MTNNHFISSDDILNPQLRAEVGGLRGCMVGAAEKHALPDRFQVTSDAHKPVMIITDTTTGREARVSLYAYGAVRENLSTLVS